MKSISFLFLSLFVLASPIWAEEGKTLAESLGYPSDARVLIINADDYAMCHAENIATHRMLETGTVTSATMMVPCPWMLEAVQYVKDNNLTNVGLHLTLTSEFRNYRWRPMSKSSFRRSTLTDRKGFFWPSSLEVELYGDILDIKREIRTQIQTVIDLGMEPSHIDSHMGSLYGMFTMRSDILAVGLANSYEYGLPFRLPYMKEFEPFRKMGFALLDNLIYGLDPPEDPEERKKFYMDIIKEIPAGVNEIFIHPAIDNEESQHITGTSDERQSDMEIFMSQEMLDLIKKENIILISYEPLKKWQREQMRWTPNFRASDVYEQYASVLKEKYTSVLQKRILSPKKKSKDK